MYWALVNKFLVAKSLEANKDTHMYRGSGPVLEIPLKLVLNAPLADAND
jgi:hypothetical protein